MKFLRDEPNEELQDEVARIREALASEIPEDEALPLIGKLGDLLRSLNQLDEAIEVIQRAINMAQKQKNRHLLLTNRLRLAIAYQYNGEYTKANPLFVELLDDFDTDSYRELLDFAYQHFGKCLVEQGQLGSAKIRLEKALQLRMKKRAPDLVRSTEEALKALKDLDPRN